MGHQVFLRNLKQSLCRLSSVQTFHKPYQGHGRGGKSCLARQTLPHARAPEYSVPVPLGTWRDSFLGQSGLSALWASDYFPAVRVMEYVTIAGDRPYFDAAA